MAPAFLPGLGLGLACDCVLVHLFIKMLFLHFLKTKIMTTKDELWF